MPSKPGSWCNRCRQIHVAQCPHIKPFERKKKIVKNSGRGGRAWQRLRQFIFTRDRFLCQECKRKGKLTAVELHGPNHGICDHIKPKAEGGTDAEDNLQTLCQSCDKAKTQIESMRGKQQPGGIKS